MTLSAAAEALLDFHPAQGDLSTDIIRGLREKPKRLPSLYFYDERGSKLFDQICELPEYYPTRTELAIMERYVGEMADRIGPRASLIELGSGSSLKTRLLLEGLHHLAAYVPVDISREHLLRTAEDLAIDYPHIDILPVCADFTEPFGLPDPQIMPVRNIVYFPGSTVGNFEPNGAKELLSVMHDIAKAGGGLLIGVDLKKDRAILERAYNDAAGVTAEFNLNILARLNRELDANFDLSSFTHHAIYDEQHGRIEMHLISNRRQTVEVDGVLISFEPDEHIVTEYSYKYTPEEFAELAREVGFELVQVWMDPERLFSVQYHEVTSN